MGRVEKTVFISYRRTNFYTALAVYQDLTAHGYDVFFDFQSIDSGNFEQIVFENIRHRAHFLVVLSPSALERCNEPGDWLRREIEMAMDENRNIIPLIMESFDFGSPAIKEALTGKLSNLSRFNGVGLNAEYFFAGMEKLRNRYLSVTLEDVPLLALSAEVEESTATRKESVSKAEEVEEKELTAEEWFEKGFRATDSDEQIRYYTEAIRLQPEYAEAYYNRGVARHNQDDLARAIADYDEAIRIKPDFPEAYNNRGVDRKDQGDFTGAIADFDKVLRIQPNDVEAYYNRGNTRKNQGDLTGAIVDYDEVIRITPEDATAYYNRGVARQTQEDFENALKDYQEVLRLEPDYGIVRMSLFGLLKKMGKVEEAKEHEILARELIHKEDEYNRACFEALCGNMDEALALLKIAFEKGQSSKAWAAQDPDLENLRDDARFKALVGE